MWRGCGRPALAPIDQFQRRREALVLVVVAGAVGLLYSDGVHSVPPFLWAGSRGVLPPAGPFIFQHHTHAPEALSVEPEELVQVGD